MRLPLLFCLLTAAFTPATAQSPIRLPQGMLGVWAPSIEQCSDKDGEARDSRMQVTLNSVEFFASMYTVRSWQRKGAIYSGRAQVANEGEGKPEPGRTPIALRLLANERLQVTLQGAEPGSWVKCPDGVYVR